MNERRTIAEQLDDARDGTEFAQAINRLFGILEEARDEDGEEDE